MTVENPFRAESVVRKLVKDHGLRSEVDREKVSKGIAEGAFLLGKILGASSPAPLGPRKPAKAIARMKAIQDLADSLPHSECGLCGCPDCQTFAEDVILGVAKETDCVVLARKRQLDIPQREGKQMTVQGACRKNGA